MYLPIPPQPDCASAWREAVRLVDTKPRHEAHNVIVDVANPIADSSLQDSRIAVVNSFLSGCEKSVETIANTIFPEALYQRYGMPEFVELFKNKILPKVRRSDRWSGYYFERMIDYPMADGTTLNQLSDIVNRLKSNQVKALNKFELSLFDPTRDVDLSPYGGQCLSFISFKIVPGQEKILTLTAMYRNHYYIEKLLGNLIGLGRLLNFVAIESGLKVGPLTVISTHAKIDNPKKSKRSDLHAMLKKFDQAAAATSLSNKGSSRDVSSN
jgi:thymidylate synthase